MPHYAVLCAFYDSWTRQTVAVEADTPAEAVPKAIAKADGPRSPHYSILTYDPGPTFAAGIVELDEGTDAEADDLGDMIVGENLRLIPSEYTEEVVMGGDR